LLQAFGYTQSDSLSQVVTDQATHQQVQQAPHHVQQADHADVEAAELIDWSCIPDFNEEIVTVQPQPQLQPKQVDSADLEAAENMDWDNLPDFDETASPLRSFLNKLIEKGESSGKTPTSTPREGSWEACERDWTPGKFMV
jgi:hypothetical protein